MNRTTLNAIGTGVGSLVVFFGVGILIGSHFATNHIERVLPPLSGKTVAAAQSLGSGSQDPGALPAQPTVNGAAIPTASAASIANTERQVGRSSDASLTLFAPASPAAAPTPTGMTTSGGHRLFLAGGPALPVQDIAHFVDPCTIVESAPGCPHGVSGTVLIADTRPAPLVITHIESLQAAPTDDYQTCVVGDTTPVPSGEGRFAIASNNPATFTAKDVGTNATLTTATTDATFRAAFTAEETTGESLDPVITCIDLPTTVTRGVLITGTDDLGTTALAGLTVGPQQESGRPPVTVAPADSDPLGMTVFVPTRSGSHERAAIALIQVPSGSDFTPSCPSSPPASPFADAQITSIGTAPTDYPAAGYTYNAAYDTWAAFAVHALHEWENPSYVMCVYWEIQPHSFSPTEVVDDAAAIPVTFPQTLSYVINYAGLQVTNSGGTGLTTAPGAVTLHPNYDPQCHWASSGPLTLADEFLPLCTVTVGDFDSGGMFPLEVDWGSVGTVAWATLPIVYCTAGSYDETGAIIAAIFTAGISSATGESRVTQDCLPDQVWFQVPVSDGTGDTANADFFGVPTEINPDSPSLIVGAPTTVAGASSGSGVGPPTPLPVDPQLDLFHTGLVPSASDPAHSLVLNWTADRPVAARAFVDSYGASTCTTPPPPTFSGGGLTLLMTSGSITLPNLCADTQYAVGVEITDENGNSSTYSRLVGLAPPPAAGDDVDFQGRTDGDRVQFNAALHLLQPNMDSPDYALITSLKVTVDGTPIMQWTSGSSGSGSSLTFTSALCVSAASPNGVTLGLDPADGEWPQAVTVRISADYLTLAGPCPGITGTVDPDEVSGLTSVDESFVLSDPTVDDTGVTAPNPPLAGDATQDLLSVEIDHVRLIH